MIDLSTFENIPIPEDEKSTRTHGSVYILFYKGTPIYVGETVDLKLRLLAHVSDGKIFDECRAEKVLLKERTKREKELILALKPILCGQYRVKHDRLVQIVDDVIFSNITKQCFKIVGNNIVWRDNIIGFIKGSKLCYMQFKEINCPNFLDFVKEIVFYDMESGKLRRRYFSKHIPLNNFYNIDLDNFKLTPKEGVCENYFFDNNGNEVFNVGKLKGKTFNEALKEGHYSYLKWFEQNVPMVQFKKDKIAA